MSRSTHTGHATQVPLIAPTPKQSPLAARQSDEKRRKGKMLGLLRQIAAEDDLRAFAVESVLILPQVETVDDWPPHRCPTTVGEMKALEARLRKWLAIKGRKSLS